ncbi:transcriptional regulator, TetR family [Chitinophaga sp. CF118]|uniref:TetR/AcrR family transcriptional regulator n=1 Tax=Chitinophaga sp. CF118 TaxID=1884367 RepID=UPI0008E9D4BB|nr:TetR/AcrR family transcriptional regulator [Chitinophaga sp. CF118]SFD32497.1 transcriptional regulator, TetR family [Chitinophaga sp. CF118]
MSVRERILETALRMFRMYGIKSVTMFDISRDCGVSKKTVYEHFRDKEDLVHEGMSFLLNGHMEQFKDFRQHSANAIEELTKELGYIELVGKTVNPVMLYEIQKYHPEIWKAVETFKRDYVLGFISENLQRGMNEGLYRSDLKIGIMARMRQLQMEAVFDPAQYPVTAYDMHEVMTQLIQHFILGITTLKGRKIAADYLQLKEEN